MEFDIIYQTVNLIEKLKQNITKDLKSKNLQTLNWKDLQLIKIIYDNKPLTKVEISRKLQKSRSDITILTAKLIKKGLVTVKSSDTDHRKQYLYLTTLGLQLVPVYLNKITEINNRIAAIMSEQDLHQFRQSLNKILLSL